MSAIGEAIGFAKSARKIEQQLRIDKTLTAEQRAKLEKDLRWYEDEARYCRNVARAEALADRDDYGRCSDPEDG